MKERVRNLLNLADEKGRLEIEPEEALAIAAYADHLFFPKKYKIVAFYSSRSRSYVLANKSGKWILRSGDN